MKLEIDDQTVAEVEPITDMGALLKAVMGDARDMAYLKDGSQAITARRAEAEFGFKRSTIRTWVDRGVVEPINTGRIHLFSLKELQEARARHRKQADTP